MCIRDSKCSVGEYDNNAYLLTCRTTGEQLLVDAAADAPRLRAFVAEGTGNLGGSVTTHRHGDHVRAPVPYTHLTLPTSGLA